MSNPLRQPDPTDKFSPDKIINSSETGTRQPGRFQPRPSVPDTQLVRNDAVRVYRSAALSIANNVAITWDSAIPNPQTALLFDTTGIWTSPSGSTFTIPLTGKITGSWRIKAQVSWPGTGAGAARQIAIVRNGSIIAIKNGPVAILDQDISDEIYNPSRGDTIQIFVFHDAGGTLALTVGSTRTFCSIIHVG